MVPEVLGLIKTLEWFEPVSEWSSLVDPSQQQKKPLQTPAGCLSLQIHYSAGAQPKATPTERATACVLAFSNYITNAPSESGCYTK